MEKLPKCISDSPATLICMNEKCNHPNPFVCDAADHKCKKDHTECLRLPWISFKRNLDQNRRIANPTFVLLCNKMQKMITKGIEQLKAELTNFNQWKNQYAGTDKIAEFYESIQLNREMRWTGKDVCLLRNDQKIKDDTKIDIQKIDSDIVKIQTKRTQLMKMIKGLYGGDKKQAPTKIMKIKQYQLEELNEKLKKLKSKPEHLELKFGIVINNEGVNQMQSQQGTISLLCRSKLLVIRIVYE